MEIERKFLVNKLPEDLESYPSALIEQGYLSGSPVVRVRQDGDSYYLTYKGAGLVAREEYNLPLTAVSYAHLLKKADGRIITKRRYRIPYLRYVIELDVFSGDFDGLVIAEVEFESLEDADAFTPPDWFGEDVSRDLRYHNSVMALGS
ncbi:MAG: CYTH domain-containing protein [Lachnospiraceae bacterium]|nr:CYTH domain-containing protein [Lachnospiraceae bacterium]